MKKPAKKSSMEKMESSKVDISKDKKIMKKKLTSSKKKK
jgi:hypothetical protein